MMKPKQLQLKHSLILLTLITGLGLGTATFAQVPATSGDTDITRSELAKFDQFLDNHPETAEQLRKDPSLINNREFIENHDNLREFLEQHPGVREEIRENPNAFMHDERRFERHEDDRDHDRDRDRDNDRRDVAKFDQFLDNHPETAEQLRKDPSLLNNREFVDNHSNLKEFLEQNPGVREEARENPNAFMHQEERFDRVEDRRDGDTTRAELASFDHFMDGHPEIAEQVQKDPSLVNNQEFVDKHPALHEYLQQHPGVHEEISENPHAFLRQEQRFEHHEDMTDRRSTDGELSSFNEFLGGHTSVAEELSRNPSLAKNQEYLASHPELQAYLKAHPGVQQQLAQNPQVVMKSAQPVNQMNKGNPTSTPVVTPADPNLKPKQ